MPPHRWLPSRHLRAPGQHSAMHLTHVTTGVQSWGSRRGSGNPSCATNLHILMRAHTWDSLRALQKAQQTRHASRWQVHTHATLACGPVLCCMQGPLRPSTTPLQPRAILRDPLRAATTPCAGAAPAWQRARASARAPHRARSVWRRSTGAGRGSSRARRPAGSAPSPCPGRHLGLTSTDTYHASSAQTRPRRNDGAGRRTAGAAQQPVHERRGARHPAASASRARARTRSSGARGVQQPPRERRQSA